MALRNSALVQATRIAQRDFSEQLPNPFPDFHSSLLSLRLTTEVAKVINGNSAAQWSALSWIVAYSSWPTPLAPGANSVCILIPPNSYVSALSPHRL